MSREPLQESLDFGRLYKVTDATRAMYRALNDAIDQVGILPAAGACGMDRGDLRRALDRDGRRLPVDAAMAVAALASIDARRRIGSAFVGCLGFVLSDERPPMTDKERADRCEAALRTLGPIGEHALVSALGGPR